ncbi:MAG: class I SAM-dependent methyltransferase [Jaaginema sp. PMC 1079.18]|nr:class I SAM-dependent methyltransferase [Jaaginema sp. PMC 1080.18]MEC4850612.1 class I SAM-dependent methyltransferase [Jaaginema sp. PMC 1079.18]MEC4867712.1 class I SAM-dependent methyltransferase [Jaaginema sp. PMC 1078.18]
MNNFEEILQSIYEKDLSEKKSWYSNVAQAYDKTRPRYPQALLEKVLELAQLPPQARILELGCGPGIATQAFAERGFRIVALEPSREAWAIAQHNCRTYADVEIINSTFEEYAIAPHSFDAVLAASSFHWISPEIRCQKAAAALRNPGKLILLWNVPPQPNQAVCEALRTVHEKYEPSLMNVISGTNHLENLQQFTQELEDSGLFTNIVFTHVIGEKTYTIADYLGLLSTLSPYIALDNQTRQNLFIAIGETLLETVGETFSTTFLAAAHVSSVISHQ